MKAVHIRHIDKLRRRPTYDLHTAFKSYFVKFMGRKHGAGIHFFERDSRALYFHIFPVGLVSFAQGIHTEFGQEHYTE